VNKLIVFVIAFFLSPVSLAGVIYPFSPQGASISVDTYANGVNCEKSAVTIEGMINLANPLNSPTALPVDSTDCYAVKAPNNDFASTYDPNTGDLYDGMFNGESKSFTVPNSHGEKIEYHVDPNLFLDHANDQWVDEDTPGWISLASIGVSGGDNEPLNFNVDYSNIGSEGDSYNLGGLLDITFGINQGIGFWSLGFDANAADIIDEIEELLGRPTRFDHLSFVLKGASNEDWYLYDFSFWDLIDDGLDIDLNDPHFMHGTWDPTEFFDGKNVSHIEIVAHDPPPPSDIPEPQSSVIFTLGIFLLALRYKMKV